MKQLKEVLLARKIDRMRIKRQDMVRNIDAQIHNACAELAKICTHSETFIKDENYEGGYLNVAEFNKITKCKICGAEVKRVTTTGGYA